MNKEGKLFLLGSVATSLALLDNFVKQKVEDGEINNGVIDKTNGFVEIERHHNKGIPLNKFDNHTKEITFISFFVLLIHAMNMGHNALKEDDALTDLAGTLILGGAISNTYDRVKRGYVVDYLKVGKKRAIYNISDFLIIGGVILTFFKAIIELFIQKDDD